MTLEVISPVDVEEASPVFLVGDAHNAVREDSLAVAQFEAIIRAWKGEDVGPVAIPVSPVGEADLDGSLSFGQLDTDIRAGCKCTYETNWGITATCPVICDYHTDPLSICHYVQDEFVAGCCSVG